MKKILLLLNLILFSAVGLFAQFGSSVDPISWSFRLEDKGNNVINLVATAKLEAGWHVYDVKIPDGGPNPTSITIEKLEGATKIGEFTTVNSKLNVAYDPSFEMQIGTYEGQAYFVQQFKVVNKGKFTLVGDIRAQACNDETCTPPLAVEFSFLTKDLPKTIADTKNESATEAITKVSDNQTSTSKVEESTTKNIMASETKVSDDAKSLISDLWAPVAKIKMYDGSADVEDSSLIWLFVLGIGGGLLALMTPCVWPLIPMTVSFFLKRNKKDKKKAVKDAIIYGLGIIIIYVGLGLIVSTVFGASALNDLSTNAFFNLFFAGLLIFFAISFLGAFEIVLPASWSNKIDSKADSTTGIISIFLMAFTLALVSFSCTGPVIGTVLVQAANTGAILAPTIVMFGFALALAIPFSLFALFPSWLESMPKSGGWLNTVKVVLGFAELILALKFLSVADLAYGWRLLDREVFLVIWIVLFALLGMYLLGKIQFKHDDKVEKLSVGRLFLAIIPLSFAMYLVPGLWGAPLKNISAFSPPLWTQDFNLYTGGVEAKFDDYELGMAYAKKVKKPVLIDFSGYGCVNCRKMESAVWSNPEVKAKLDEEFVLITLMVDDKKQLPEQIVVIENGREVKLKTIGDKWSYLQRHKFAINSQPYYVLLDHEGQPLGPSFAYKEDVPAYLDFLNIGITNFKNK